MYYIVYLLASGRGGLLHVVLNLRRALHAEHTPKVCSNSYIDYEHRLTLIIP
jgi:hypothetical protein